MMLAYFRGCMSFSEARLNPEDLFWAHDELECLYALLITMALSIQGKQK